MCAFDPETQQTNNIKEYSRKPHERIQSTMMQIPKTVDCNNKVIGAHQNYSVPEPKRNFYRYYQGSLPVACSFRSGNVFI